LKLRGLTGVLAALGCSAALALDVVAEADAPIINDDMVLARQTALRRAQANAVEQSTGLLQATTVATQSGVSTHTTLSPQGRATGARVLSEHVAGNRLRLTAEVSVVEPGQPAVCRGRPLRKTVVTAFPLRYPEQIKYGEFMGWPQMTAEELTRRFNSRGKLLSAAMAGQFPFPSADEAPLTERKDNTPLPVEWARKERAQYVLAGTFRDFGVAKQALVIPERQLVIEAYLYDGISGELVARREFARSLNFSWQMPKAVTPGSRDFATSRLGQTYYQVLDDLSQWAEATLGCLPLPARVVRADGRQLYLDVGSDSGIETGQELVLTQAAASVATPAGDMLPGERTAVAGAVIRQVHPRHSVAEITAKNLPAVRPGDVLYLF
jgi:hypothetical protein